MIASFSGIDLYFDFPFLFSLRILLFGGLGGGGAVGRSGRCVGFVWFGVWWVAGSGLPRAWCGVGSGVPGLGAGFRPGGVVSKQRDSRERMTKKLKA